MDLSREILRNRHCLSERQIDDFLGEMTHSENQQDRLLRMQRIGNFLEIAKILNEENIWFLNLKGPLFSQRIYGDPIYRAFRDFDILVNPKDVNRSLQLLEKTDTNPPNLHGKIHKKTGDYASFYQPGGDESSGIGCDV